LPRSPAIVAATYVEIGVLSQAQQLPGAGRDADAPTGSVTANPPGEGSHAGCFGRVNAQNFSTS